MAIPTPVTGVSHRIPLEGTTWSLWRDVALRGAGFPADRVLALCDEPLAHAADLGVAELDKPGLAGPDGVARRRRPRRAQAQDARPEYATAYPEAVSRLSQAIADAVAEPVFREAVTWQNPRLAQRLQDAAAGAGMGAGRRAKDRERELVVASYLQRYCLKNDTIGFFGPVGWASVEPGTPGLAVTPGPELLARRTTYFEVWAIDKVAAVISGQGRMLGWLRPQRARSVYLDGQLLHRPHRPPAVLTDTELRILGACDDRRTISDIVASAAIPDARAVLARLAALGAIRLDLEGPADAWPERLLQDQLRQIADPAARAAALAPVDRLITARDAAAAAAGDPARLQQALAALAETFEEVTGSAATRRDGTNYAGRTVVYHDTVRDARVELGDAVTAALAAPLGLVLDSARWLVNEIAARYREMFLELLDLELARAGGQAVPLQRLLTMASAHLFFQVNHGLPELAAACTAELQRRWRDVLGAPAAGRRHHVTADAIAARAAAAFPRHPAAWSAARQHSPDIMIAAASASEVQRGNFLLVLGELHTANNTLDSRALVQQHPDPARLIAAEHADHGTRRIVGILAKNHPYVTSRTSPPSALLGPGLVGWSSGVADAIELPEPATVLPGAGLVVTRRGDELVVQLRPSGPELDFFEVIGDLMSAMATNAFQPIAHAAHQPRITVDRLVLSREQWTFPVEDCAWAFAAEERDRYYLARRWRHQHGLPERVFVRVPVEAKPTAADFRSIVLVNLLAKHIRQTKAAGHSTYTVSEMLPDTDQLWLTDQAGQHYSSELRFVAYDELG
jgi:hypothetical protein